MDSVFFQLWVLDTSDDLMASDLFTNVEASGLSKQEAKQLVLIQTPRKPLFQDSTYQGFTRVSTNPNSLISAC